MISIKQIQEAVCDVFGVSMAEMKSPRRHQGIARPRHLAMYLARKLTFRSLSEIGMAFNRDHTSIMHGVEMIEKNMTPTIERQIQMAKDILAGVIPSAVAGHFAGYRPIPKAVMEHFGMTADVVVRRRGKGKVRSAPRIYVYEQSPRNMISVSQRDCLVCGDEFQSEGAHNRLCTPCRGQSYYGTDMGSSSAPARGAGRPGGER